MLRLMLHLSFLIMYVDPCVHVSSASFVVINLALMHVCIIGLECDPV